MSALSVFDKVEQGPPDAVFGIVDRFNKATAEWKALPTSDPKAADEFKPINIIVGAYRDENGKPWVLPTVRQIEKEMAEDPALEHEYLPITGLKTFIPAAQKLMFGEEKPTFASVQVLSGTGAIYTGFSFLKNHVNCTKVIGPTPTWPNHPSCAKTAGLEYGSYPYYDNAKNSIVWDQLIESLEKAEANTVVLLHACAHNPTGMDPTNAQWEQLADLFTKRATTSPLIPFFDCAYQGYASGDVEKDAFAVRLFTSRGLPVIVAHSFSKSMGLYGERCGCLHIACSSADAVKRVTSQLSIFIRATYSNPPGHGAKIATKLLSEPAKYDSWLKDLNVMTARLHAMRTKLREGLEKAQKESGAASVQNRDWTHITTQTGMFSFTGLTKDECAYMEKEHKVFLTPNGRISIAGLNDSNVERVAKCMIDSIIKCQ